MPEQEQRSAEEVAATIRNLDAEAAFYAAQERKEQAMAEAAEIQLAELKRTQALELAGDSHNRVYQFISAVSDNSVESCMVRLSQWARISKEPITVCFNSPGGSVIAGLRLYDFLLRLREEGIHLTTITLGYAASMAGVLLQAGTRRVIGPNAYLLVHEVSAGAVGKIGELEDSVDFSRSLNQRLFSILAERAKVSRQALLNKAKRKDVWIDSGDAVNKFGLADEIGYR